MITDHERKERHRTGWIAALILAAILIAVHLNDDTASAPAGQAAQAEASAPEDASSPPVATRPAPLENLTPEEKESELEAAGGQVPFPQRVNLARMVDAYNANELKADQQYKNDFLEVTGVVNSVGVHIGTPDVVLEGGVMASFNASDERDLASLNKGETITLVCLGRGKILFYVLLDCTQNLPGTPRLTQRN